MYEFQTDLKLEFMRSVRTRAPRANSNIQRISSFVPKSSPELKKINKQTLTLPVIELCLDWGYDKWNGLRLYSAKNLRHAGHCYTKNGKLMTDGITIQSWRCAKKSPLCPGRLQSP